ncbi:MAG: heparinase II/III domain-containing protein [Actinomycetes bacterium]
MLGRFALPVVSRQALDGPRRGRPAAVAAALVLAIGLATLQGSPAEAATPLHANVAAAAAQCSMSHTAYKGQKRATDVMAGRVSLGQYGSFHLAKNPSWKPVSTLDSSGKGHMHSLHYLLPLLRYGVRTGNKPMVDRFYAVLKDWVHDNPPSASTRRYAWGPPIYEGFRALVLVCAAAGPHGQAPWLLKALALHGKMMSDPRRYEGVNNASLHQAMGLYAIGATLGRRDLQNIAITRERALAVRLIESDGSDNEGALSYAINNYRWFQDAAERLRRGGDRVPAELGRVALVPRFIAQATRPDGRVEALGDTSPSPLSTTAWAGTEAEFPATLGASGTVPTDTFAAFRGGYAFGRSGWGTTRALQDETFFSVRAGGARGIPHAHDDAGSLTLYAYGSPLLLDTGQWRYTYGTTRSFVVSRAAHNVVVVHGVARSRPGRPAFSASQTGGLDLATVVDRGYSGVTITRTVAYDRADDVLLVWDRLTATKPVTASQQWGLGRTRRVSLDADAVHTTGDGPNLSMLFTSGGAPLDVARGKKSPMRGWNSEAYGELAPAPSVRATQSGTSLSWLTVIAPRAPGVPASSFSATSAADSRTASVVLTTSTGSARVTLDSNGGSRSEAAPLVPAVTSTQPIVLARAQTTMRATGLPPSAPVTLETRQVEATDWSPVAQSAASAAGTATFAVPVPATADYRVVSDGTVSPPSRVTAAVAPAPPPLVSAASSGRGVVTVTWEPPLDTGGAPLTRFVVRVNGVRTVVPASARSLVVRGVVAGARAVSVRGANAVATSGATSTRVAVPAYPSVSGPTSVRKGRAVTFTLRGLLPGAPTSVTLSPAKAGRVRTKPVKVSAAGTAKVVVVVKKSLRIVVRSGGVASSARKIRAH